MIDYLELFVRSWERGDLEGILRAVSNDFVYDDPRAGRLSKSEFADHSLLLVGCDEQPQGESGGRLDSMTNVITEQVTVERDGEQTSWCWWVEPAASQEGAALFKAGPYGVRLNRVAYFTPG